VAVFLAFKKNQEDLSFKNASKTGKKRLFQITPPIKIPYILSFLDEKYPKIPL